MTGKRFEQFKVGDSATIKHKVTLEDVKKFVALTGDDNPLHVDKVFAQKTVFKDTVVHGMLGASFVSTLVGKHIPGDGALWIAQNFEFLLPVRINDELTIRAEVVEVHEKQNLLVLDTQITNQHKQVVVKGIGKVKKLAMERVEAESLIVPQEQVVIVIGGSRGIGAATAEYLAKKGYSVAIVYSKDQSGAETVLETIKAQGGKAMICQADVRNQAAVNAMVSQVVAQFGGVTALVYGATSKVIAADFEALEWQDLEEHFAVQLKGAFYCTQRVLKEFLPQKQGAVVFIGSLAADAAPLLKVTGYATSKAALHMLAKSLALEYGPQGVRFNIVSPGVTETGLIADIPEKARLLAKMQNPLRRLAQPEDIVGAIEFLLSPEARHITGETIRIYGGQVML